MPDQGDAARQAGHSAVERLIAYRKTKSSVVGGFVVFLAMPLICFLLIGTGLPMPFVVTGFILLIITGLIWAALPIVAVAGLIVGLGAMLKSDMTRTFGEEGIFTPKPKAEASAAAPLRDDLAALVGAVETIRSEFAAKRRTALSQPVALVAAASFGLPLLLVVLNGGNNWLIVPICGLVFTSFAWFSISARFEQQFATAFKDRLFPSLLSRYGNLERRNDHVPDVGRGVSVGTIWTHNQIAVDDVFSGTRDGHAITVAELELKRVSGTRRRRRISTRRVLIITVALDGIVPAPVVVTSDSAIDMGGSRRDPQLEAVRLDDEAFERIYAVFAQSTLAARTILTPSIMQRMLTMSDAGGFLPPLLLAEGDALQFFIYTVDNRNLFEPLSVADDTIATHLESLDRDLTQVFGLVDAAIETGRGLPLRPAGWRPDPARPPIVS